MKKYILVLNFIFFLSCALDEYTGYNYTTQQLSETTQISGHVTSFFTGYPVYDARLQFGTQETLTDFDGFYSLNYLLSDDENRNKPSPLTIIKPNYYPYSTELMLLPTGNTLNFSLKYASPIIYDTRRVPYYDQLICQAILKDYQGIGTISSVNTIYYFLNDDGSISDSVSYPMSLVHIENNFTGYYQFIQTEISSAAMAAYYNITARDNEGYTDRLFHSTNPIYPDHFLFDPNI